MLRLTTLETTKGKIFDATVILYQSAIERSAFIQERFELHFTAPVRYATDQLGWVKTTPLWW